MELESKNIILKNKRRLVKNINLDKLRPFLTNSKIFTNAMLTDIFHTGSDYDLFAELLTRGPDAYCKFLKVLEEAGYHEEVKALKGECSKIPMSTIGLCYKMISKPLGFCKIINNVQFQYLAERYGSDADAASLRRIFSMMGYAVLLENNLTGAEMRTSLQKFSEHESWASVDSCIVVILSHGGNFNNLDVIYGTDSDYIDKMDIYELFDNNNCKQLQHKPKIFFFQACRGNSEDDGAYYAESTDAAKIVKTPSMSDMLIVHSALPNHKSYRDHVKGSWFCQDLVQVLSDDHLNHPLETMLQSVDRKIESRLSVKHKKQVTHIDKFGVKANIYFSINSMTELPEFYIPKFN